MNKDSKDTKHSVLQTYITSLSSLQPDPLKTMLNAESVVNCCCCADGSWL